MKKEYAMNRKVSLEFQVQFLKKRRKKTFEIYRNKFLALLLCKFLVTSLISFFYFPFLYVSFSSLLCTEKNPVHDFRPVSLFGPGIHRSGDDTVNYLNWIHLKQPSSPLNHKEIEHFGILSFSHSSCRGIEW